MPIYEYTCRACSKTCDFLQKVSDAAKTDCPNCGKPDLKKMISSTSFQLKGSGWYVTDFKNSGKQKTETEKSSNTEKTDKKETKETKKTSDSETK